MLWFKSTGFPTMIVEEDIRLMAVHVPVEILIAAIFLLCGTIREAMLLTPTSEIPAEI